MKDNIKPYTMEEAVELWSGYTGLTKNEAKELIKNSDSPLGSQLKLMEEGLKEEARRSFYED